MNGLIALTSRCNETEDTCIQKVIEQLAHADK